MGNRAVITTKKEWQSDGIGVYLHWNGGRDSVEAFLEYCKLKGYRAPDSDCYGWARLCQVLGNFFGGTLSVGIDRLWFLDRDNGDNGVYILEGWDIIDRYYYEGPEQNEYDRTEMLIEIDNNMPKKEQLGERYLRAPYVDTKSLKVGDKVFVQEYEGQVHIQEIVGIGEDRIVNGTNVAGIPYIAEYAPGNPQDNINNYLREARYKIAKNPIENDKKE